MSKANRMPNKYVVLLRGVNVGGNHRVPKDEFRDVLTGLGYYDVKTYINSGNAVFTASAIPSARDIQSALESHFGFGIPTLLLPAEKVQAIARAIPESWTNDAPGPSKSGYKSDVLYLFDDVNSPSILAKIGYKPEIETMLFVDGAVLATISRANQSKGSLLRLIGTPLYTKVTIRNITTAKKLAELAG